CSTASALTHLYPLSLHDALPISPRRPPAAPARPQLRRAPALPHPPARLVPAQEPHGRRRHGRAVLRALRAAAAALARHGRDARRSEEHTSELQSRENLVCRLLLE